MPELTLVEFYTDGACLGNGRAGGGHMGAGIVGKSADFHKEWGIPLGTGTNQKAELLAVREALLRLRNRGMAHVRVYTDSAYAIGCLTQNWKVKTNTDLVEEVRTLVATCGRFEMRKVLGHSGVAMNERADELGRNAASSGEPYTGPPQS